MAYQTPYFVIDENQLTKDFQMLKSSLETSWGNYRIGYSFKTNSLPWLVTFLKAGGVMAEVVSDDEYSLAGALGFSDSEIVYNGPVKKRPSFELNQNCGSGEISVVNYLHRVLHFFSFAPFLQIHHQKEQINLPIRK